MEVEKIKNNEQEKEERNSDSYEEKKKSPQTKKKEKLFSISNIVLVLSIVFLISTAVVTFQAKKSNTDSYLFGYKPIFILTGSMEPTIKTNGVVLVKKVDDIHDIQKGDIVTYHWTDEDGTTIRITHRIHDIDNGKIVTKGDNNDNPDFYPLTMENIDAKVITIMNWVAPIYNTWQSPNGKLAIFLGVSAVVVGIWSIRFYFSRDEDREEDGVSKNKKS